MMMTDEQPTPTPTISPDVLKQPEDDPVSKAERAAERIEAALKKMEEATRRQEELATRIVLGGGSRAGSVTKSKEELEQEAIDKRVAETLKRYRTS